MEGKINIQELESFLSSENRVLTFDNVIDVLKEYKIYQQLLPIQQTLRMLNESPGVYQYVIHGSFSLWLFGFIDRLPQDLDISLIGSGDICHKDFKYGSKADVEDGSGIFKLNNQEITCITGYSYGVKIDIFHNPYFNINKDCIKVKVWNMELLVEKPLSALYAKSHYSTENNLLNAYKHFNDIKEIESKFNNCIK